MTCSLCVSGGSPLENLNLSSCPHRSYYADNASGFRAGACFTDNRLIEFCRILRFPREGGWRYLYKYPVVCRCTVNRNETNFILSAWIVRCVET